MVADKTVTPADTAQLQQLLDDVVAPGTPTAALPITVPEPGADATPQEQCLALVGAVTVPSQLADQFSSGVQALCGGLDSLDPAALTGLLGNLTNLLEGLAESLPTPDGNIPSTPPAGTPAQYAGYWWKHHDVNCSDVSYDEAQAILALDRRDPFNLDGDGDGVACERNARYVECWDGHDHEVVRTADYEGYPVGGVSTGDSDPATDAAPVAASALGLLMTAGLASASGGRRRDPADELDGADLPQAV